MDEKYIEKIGLIIMIIIIVNSNFKPVDMPQWIFTIVLIVGCLIGLSMYLSPRLYAND